MTQDFNVTASQSRSSVDRLLRLVVILNTGCAYSSRELAETLNVSRRSIFRYIRRLRDGGIDVQFNEVTGGYQHGAPTRLSTVRMTDDEIVALLLYTQSALSARSALVDNSVLLSARSKLVRDLSERTRSDACRLMNCIWAGEGTATYVGDQYERTLALLKEAIVRRVRLRIEFQVAFRDAAKKTKKTLLAPYHLVFRHHSWSVIGRSSIDRGISFIRINRINSAELTEEPFDPPRGIDIHKIIHKTWGAASVQGGSGRITVRFDPEIALDVAECQWHPTQTNCWSDDGSLELTFQISDPLEMTQWIAMYGPLVTVIEPIELHRSVQAYLTQSINASPSSQ